MNAKKACSLALILTVLITVGMPAACAQNASINVTGSLVNPTCTATGTYQQDFGEIYIDKSPFFDSLSTRVINIQLTNCSNTTVTATATFSGTTDGNSVFFKNLGSATGLIIRAYQDTTSGTHLGDGTQWTKNVDVTSHSVTFPTVFTLERKVIVSGSTVNAAAITSGTVLAVISVSFSYS